MALHIIVDSTCDITQTEAARMGIQVLPLSIHFGAQEYRDGVDLSTEKFYAMLTAGGELPTTSQVTPWQFQEALAALGEGDEAVIITVSGRLSGTLQSALIAAKSYGSRVRVVDSLNAAIGIRIQVEYAVRMRDAGLDAAAIEAELLARRDSVVLLGVVDTLDYLKRGGRISSAVALAGGLLGIKPVLTAKNGELGMLGKARGLTQSNNLLNRTVAERGGINFSLPFAVGFTGTDDTAARNYLQQSAGLWQIHTAAVPVCRIGCGVGVHVGPGAVAVAFYTPADGGAVA